VPDIPAQLAAALADRYTIEHELGRGGNAVVYLAHDRKHDRRVALKVLLPELAQSVRTERFLREIQIAAKLHHSHILMLIDSGATDGFLYYVMPFVEGESLRDRLQREKQIPVADALQIAREVADALSYAHQHDVVHRDIKPENILLQAGHAVVADFGIARALSEARGQTVTQTGIAVGTPVYMSPEQGGGSKALDGRSDVYSLACVLYEMLAGQPPFTGESAQEILAHHALDPVPRLRKRRPDVTADVEDVILHALAKRPVERLGTAAEFAAALAVPGTARPGAMGRRVRRTRRLWLSAGLGLAVLVTGYVVAVRTHLLHPAGPAASAHSVAVLPFVNLSGDTAYEYFSDGMTEELIDALVQVPGLQVPARTSAFVFKGKTGDIREIGRRLNVSTVVEGSVRRSGTRLRVSAQLIKVSDGFHLWSATYERELRDVFAVQDELTRAIVQALKVKLALTPLPARPENFAAYELYLKGRMYWNRGTVDGFHRALDLFSEAIAQDSGYARAYAGVADVYDALMFRADLPRSEGYPKARAAAGRAVALDSQLAEAYTSRARVRFRQEWDLARAEQDFRRAIALNPGYALGHQWYGAFLATRGRYPEAMREARRAAELDPLSAQVLLSYNFVLGCARQYGAAAEQARKALQLEASPVGHERLGSAYLGQGRFTDAIREFQAALALGGRRREAFNLSLLGAAYARAGRRQEALKILEDLKHLAAASGDSTQTFGLPFARLYAALEERDQALAWLERAYQEHDVALTNLQGCSGQVWNPLRSDPRFRELLKKVALEP
jgi:TolB-like protein/tRNA A-37 threonylcarbamoyl transferase component Bud32/Tfp pilus assembly protein PilF